MLEEDLRLPKGQENLHVTEHGKRRKNKRKRKKSGWALCLWEGAVKEEKASAHWEVPSLMRSAVTERGGNRASEESSATEVQRTKPRET